MASPYDHDDSFYFSRGDLDGIAAVLMDASATPSQIEAMESVLSAAQTRAAPYDWRGNPIEREISLQGPMARIRLTRNPMEYFEALATLKKPKYMTVDTWSKDFRVINDIELDVQVRLNIMSFIETLGTKGPQSWEASAYRLLRGKEGSAPSPRNYASCYHEADVYSAMVLKAFNTPDE